MDTDPNLILALLAVRTLGGPSVPADADAIKALKKSVKEAVEKGWLKEDAVTETVPVEGKKPKTKKTAVVALTDEGERVLSEAARPEALAAARAKGVAALIEHLHADRAALKTQAAEALAAKGDDKPAEKAAAELAKLSKDLAALAGRIEKLEAVLSRPAGPGAILAKFDEALAGLRARVEQALGGAPAAPAPAEPPAPAPAEPPSVAAPPPPPAAPPTLTQALHGAYERLKETPEYKQKMVELPRLYQEARRDRPSLSVAEYHQALRELEETRAIDLHLHPDAGNAADADKAVHRNNKVYYYIYWSRS